MEEEQKVLHRMGTGTMDLYTPSQVPRLQGIRIAGRAQDWIENDMLGNRDIMSSLVHHRSGCITLHGTCAKHNG
jgi:hypothetical protein